MKGQQRAESSIVFATDFLKPAQRAFAYALALAQALQLCLVILHVIKGVADARDPRHPDRSGPIPLNSRPLYVIVRYGLVG